MKKRTYTRPLLVDLLPSVIGRKAMTCEQIATLLDRSANAVRVLIAKLYNDVDNQRVYIAAWFRGRGPHTPMYRWGCLPDAPRLKPVTAAEACKRYRESSHGRKKKNACQRRWYRKHGSIERKQARDNKRALEAFSKQGVAGIDPLMAAVMGVQP